MRIKERVAAVADNEFKLGPLYKHNKNRILNSDSKHSGRCDGRAMRMTYTFQSFFIVLLLKRTEHNLNKAACNILKGICLTRRFRGFARKSNTLV